MVDKEKNTSQEDQNPTDWNDPKEQEPQPPVGSNEQEQQEQEQQPQDQEQQEQEPQDQGQESPEQETPEQTDDSGKPEDDDSGQQTGKTCVKKDSVRDNLEKQKWTNQLNQIESKCDQSLSDCLNKSNEDSLKLLNDVETAVSKYRDDYEKLRNQLKCMKTNNESALKDVPASHTSEINPIIVAAQAKIKELESCKEKLECPVNGEGGGNNTGEDGDKDQDKPNGNDQVVPGDGDPVILEDQNQTKPDDKKKDSDDDKDEGKDDENEGNGDCNYNDYPLLSKKPKIDLGCSESARKALKTLMTAKCELERSGRYHDAMETKFNDAKNTQTVIEDYLKKITDLQTKAQKAKEEGKLCQVSAYTLLIKVLIEETEEQLVKVDVLNTNMSKALKGLAAAKVDKCYREYTNCKIEAMIELVNKSLEEAKKNRDEDILKKIVSTRT